MLSETDGLGDAQGNGLERGREMQLEAGGEGRRRAAETELPERPEHRFAADAAALAELAHAPAERLRELARELHAERLAAPLPAEAPEVPGEVPSGTPGGQAPGPSEEPPGVRRRG